jgi:tetratricopeptide (TPR) repeat protein
VTQEEVQEAAVTDVARAAELASHKSADCKRIVDTIEVSFAVSGAKGLEKATGALPVFAECAQKAQSWFLLRDVSAAMLAADPSQKLTHWLPRAWLGLGQADVAARELGAMIREWPKDAEVYATNTLALCRQEDWEKCIAAAEQTFAYLRQRGIPASDDVAVQTHLARSEALARSGKFDEALREIEQVRKVRPELETLNALRDRVTNAKASRVIIDGSIPSEVHLATLPLHVKNTAGLGAFATLKLYNFANKALSVRAEVSVDGVSETAVKSVTAQARKETVRLSPGIKVLFEPQSVREPQPVQVTTRVTSKDGETVYWDERAQTTLYPRNYFPQVIVRGSEWKPVPELLAAWITPKSKAVSAFVAAGRHDGDGHGKGPSLPVVEDLVARARRDGITFDRDPSIDARERRTLKTRFASEVLATKEPGHALEGVAFYASLLEAAGLDPILVRVPGHAFVGWLATRGDHGSAGENLAIRTPLGQAFFFETTAGPSIPFEAAVLRADAEFLENVNTRAFSEGRASYFLLSKLRRTGIAPLATE